MPLAYYSRAATSEFWSEHWGGHTAMVQPFGQFPT